MSRLVSIVIPTYNRAKDLERALMSVLNQTYTNWEALVVDNYSTDKTDDLVAGFNDPRIKLFKVHNEGVIAVSRNLGIKSAQGKYVAFLDSDDWWVPNKLEESIKYLEQGADVVYHDLFLVKKANQKYFWGKTKCRNLISPVFNDLILNGNTLNNSSVVIRRDILEMINGFAETKELVAAEDYDGWLRVSKITEKFMKIPKTLGYYWMGGGNTSGAIRTLISIELIEKIYAKDLLNIKSFQDSYYFDYIKGRAYFSSGEFVEAEKYLDVVCRKRRVPFPFYFKSMVMRLSIIAKRFI